MKIDELKAQYVSYFEDVPIQKYAASYIGRDEDTIIRWRKNDKAFADAVQRAKAIWIRKKFIATKAEFALEKLEKEIFGNATVVEPPIVYRYDIREEEGKNISQKFTDFMLEATYSDTPQDDTDSARSVTDYSS